MNESRRSHAEPPWVLSGGCALAFLAAAVNADFMIRIGVSVSHLTGDLSRITSESIRMGGHWNRDASLLCVSIAGFVSGATISGLVIHHPRLELRRPYGRCLIAVGCLLILAALVAGRSAIAACSLAALACGLQNALATRYRGIVLRTTHITGLLTDLGQLLGMRLGGHRVEIWKITTPLMIAVAFGSGAALGALLSLATAIDVTLNAGILYLGGGLIRSIFKCLDHSQN